MQLLMHNQNDYAIRFDYGEELLSGLKAFCEKEKITAASFTAIGAAQKIVISYYEMEKKIYHDRVINEDVEIVGMTGNVAVKEGAVVIHIHGTFSDAACGVVGGHVKETVISASCEVMLRRYPTTFQRKFDEQTGLSLLTTHPDRAT